MTDYSELLARAAYIQTGPGVFVSKDEWQSAMWDAFPALADAIKAVMAERDEWLKSQHYRYIGRDGKTWLARDLESRAEAAEAENAALRASKDAAYLERNKLVALLAAIFPSGVKRTAIDGWSDDWHGCVYIDFPWGQASWHHHDSQADLFSHLPPYAGEWDGHTTEAKYAAIVEASQKHPISAVDGYVPALRARVEELEAAELKMRDEIFEASHPDFLFGAMDKVADMDTTLDEYAQAASRAIRAALRVKKEAGE